MSKFSLVYPPGGLFRNLFMSQDMSIRLEGQADQRGERLRFPSKSTSIASKLLGILLDLFG